MKEFFSKIKDKLFPQPELDFEGDEASQESEIIDDVEIDTQDPEAISSAKKKNIMMVIFALFASALVYYFVFSEGEVVKEDLISASSFSTGVSGSGQSPFEIDIDKQPDEEIAVLDKPSIPKLPAMPEGDKLTGADETNIFDEDIFEEDEPELEEKDPKDAKILKTPEEKKEDEEKIAQELLVKKKASIKDEKFNDPRYAPIIVLKGSAGAGFPGAGQDDNLKILNQDALSDLDDSVITIKPSFVKNRENVIGQGKIINAVLETAIDTEMPGSVRAIVSRDVYGEVGSRILISKGSRLYGAYSTETAKGNSRININWTRLLRPDGVSVAINSIASDQFGRAGVKGVIDNKFKATISNTILSSILAIAGIAATDSLTGGQSSTVTTDPSSGTSTVTQSAINQAVTDITQNITNSATGAVAGYFDTTPRITVAQGTKITVLVNSGIKIPIFKGKSVKQKKTINLHLISDSTGETLSSVARATLSQFEDIESNDFVWPLVRTKSQIKKINESITQNPGIVMYTILQNDITDLLVNHCNKLQVPHISVLSDIVQKFSSYLNMDTSNVIGRQHLLDDEYFSRVEAINYTMTHDDGQSDWNLNEADIILVGVSRTSKTPTSIYLSCRGYKTANIPFVSADTIPKTLEENKNSLIVGLVINPEKLINIRSARLSSLGQDVKTDYIDIESVKQEILESRKLFAKLNCPVIDVTNRSVEETSAKIVQFHQSKNINSN